MPSPRRRLYSELADFGQIRWAEQFVDVDVDHLKGMVRVVPGRWSRATRAASWAAVPLWRLADIWVGAAHAEASISRFASTLAWWLVAGVAAWHLLQARWSMLAVAAALLAGRPTARPPAVDLGASTGGW